MGRKIEMAIRVTKETYETVYKRDKGMCVICLHEGEDNQLHHIKTRGNRKLINDVDNCVMLCSYHHSIVHHNMKHWAPILEKYVEVKNYGRTKNDSKDNSNQ